MTLEHIEQLTKVHATDRALVAERVSGLNAEIENIKKRRLPGIKAAVVSARTSRLQLQSAIDSQRALFTRPRTRMFHGIKVGLQKAKGKLRFEDAKQVVKLIRKHFSDQFDVLVRTEEKPVKSALLQLPAADLKKVGCSILGVGDVVLIEPADSDIDKLIDTLLSEKADENNGENDT